MRRINILIGLTCSLTFFACSDKGSGPHYTGTSSFPLTVDRHWFYYGERMWTSFDDTTAPVLRAYLVHRRVIRPDTVIGECQTYIVDDSTSYPDSIDTESFVTRRWYGLSDMKLLEFAHIDIYPGGDTIPYFYNAPHVVLDFPLNPGKTWAAYSTPISNIICSVERADTIRYYMHSVECEVVRERPVNPVIGHPPFDTRYWYNESGLYKYERDLGIEYVSDESGRILDSLMVKEYIGPGLLWLTKAGARSVR